MAGILTRTQRNAARGGVLAFVLVVMSVPRWAPATPLHRHALEHWPAENYSVLIFHHEPLSSSSQGLVEILEAGARESGANLSVTVVDVNQPMAEPVQTLWFTQTGVEPPWMVVLTPGQSNAAPVWAGTLGLDSVNALLESPARRKIVEGLLDGAAAVWVLLECGDAVRDEAAVDLLAAELKRQEQKLTADLVSANGPASPGPGRGSIRGGFSLVRVTRKDRAEEFFVTNLLYGISFTHAKPVAFPVYGRGRILEAPVGRKLNADTIAASCAAITRACSNEAKALHPGKDLLIAARWAMRLSVDGPNIFLAQTPNSARTNPGEAKVLTQESAVTNAGTTVTMALPDATEPKGPANFWSLAVVVIGATCGIGYWVLRPKPG